MSALTEIFAAHGQRIRVSADEAVISRGYAIARLFYIVDGQVLLHSTSPGGREVAFRIKRNGDLLGLTSLGSECVAIFDATTITPCEFLAVDRTIVQRRMLESPAATLEAFDILVQGLRNRTDLAESLASHNLRARLARWILSRLEEENANLVPGVELEVDISQRLIAAFAGVSRETVNRQLKDWSEDGIINMAGRTLRILRPESLVRLAAYAEDLRSD